MALSRREFLKIMGGAVAAFTFPGIIIQGCKRSLERAVNRAQIIWLQGQSCSGCSVSLLNSIDPDIVSLITNFMSLNFHQTLMAGTGDVAVSVLEQAIEKKRKDFILVIEGSLPVNDDLYCTMGGRNGHHISVREWIVDLAKNAKAVIAVGSCAAFGGIVAAEIRGTGKNPTGAKPVSVFLKDNGKVVNVPGCPPHPDWMVGVLYNILLKDRIPELDSFNRPKLYFNKTVHEQCEFLSDYKRGHFARKWGEPGCLYLLGCLGMDTYCDIPKRRWLGVNTCTASGSGCIGCTEKPFPDFGNRGIYKHMSAGLEDINLIKNTEIRNVVLNMKKGGSLNGHCLS